MRSILFSFLAICSLLIGYEAKDFSHLIGMPGFSKELLEMHFKLYRGYVKNTNYLLQKISEIELGSYEFGALKRRLGWEFDGMRLHEMYFMNLGGNGHLRRKSPLYLAIVHQFGSFQKFRDEFIAVGTMRGIGWAMLYLDPVENRLINVWINEHDVGHLVKGNALLVMDVWEHAYITEYGLDRKKYIDVFFQNIDWEVVEKRYRNKSLNVSSQRS